MKCTIYALELNLTALQQGLQRCINFDSTLFPSKHYSMAGPFGGLTQDFDCIRLCTSGM